MVEGIARLDALADSPVVAAVGAAFADAGYELAIVGGPVRDALMGRLGLDILTLGDYHLLGASILAWVGIGLVAVVATLGPTRTGLRP